MGCDAILEARYTRDKRREDDLIVGYSRTMPLPWLMLFDRACLTIPPDDAPELISDRARAVARFRTRAAVLVPRMDFVPDAARLLADFANYLAALPQPWLSLCTWEQWLAVQISDGQDFTGSVTRALDALEQGAAISDAAWHAVLDWSHPTRRDTAHWRADHKTALFGWPSVGWPWKR